MSRVGKKSISIPSGVNVTISATDLSVKGPKGELSSPLFPGITASVAENEVSLQCDNLTSKSSKANYGMARALLANNILGVSCGFTRTLELRGVGYRAQVQGSKLNLSLGFSHPVEYPVPQGIEIKVDKSLIHIHGVDKQTVGQIASEIRAFRPPEPYKGKGVRYQNERVIMKEGKKS
ncbi:MAG: 50S ribosomal protein L6 [Mariprofundaceae bacterium]|nr:50S ribosomal protein L6 [Mariprofundaceae bacterium]